MIGEMFVVLRVISWIVIPRALRAQQSVGLSGTVIANLQE